MKNLFKKSAKKELKSTFQKLEKDQLEKIIGGETTPIIKINESQRPMDTINGLIR